MDARHFDIHFDGWYRALSSALLIPPSRSYVELSDGDVHVRMGWAFDARFPRAAIASALRSELKTISRGVHGWGGRWLVNGSGQGLVALTLEPEQRGRVMGVPVRLRELYVSVDDPDALIAAIR